MQDTERNGDMATFVQLSATSWYNVDLIAGIYYQSGSWRIRLAGETIDPVA